MREKLDLQPRDMFRKAKNAINGNPKEDVSETEARELSRERQGFRLNW